MPPKLKPVLVQKPYGQTAGKDIKSIIETRKTRLLKGWDLDVPSFSVWCDMFCYDTTQPNGGASFSQMLHWLMVDGTKHDKLEPDFKLSEDFLSLKPSKIEKSNKLSEWYIGYTAGVLPIHKGGGTGRNSDQPGMNGDKNAMKLNFENGVTCVPYSKSNWLRAFGLRDPNLNNSSMNSAYTVGMQKRKGTSVNAKEERNGGDQVAVANTIAVLAGLYHYPGCDSNAANWIVEQTVEQTVKGKKSGRSISFECAFRIPITRKMAGVWCRTRRRRVE